MIYKLFILGLAVTNVLGAPTTVVPPEKQQPTVIPIISQSEELVPNGTYTFSYETGNGIKREETSYDKIIPKAESRSASSKESEESDEDYDSNEIHVQRGSYSYTAPDGTVITLSYIADENGFQPIGNHLPRSPVPVPASLNIQSAKSKSVPKAPDSSGSGSIHLSVTKPLKPIPVIAARIADTATSTNSEPSTPSKSLNNTATAEVNISKESSVNTEPAASSVSESENNSEKSVKDNDISKPGETVSPIQPKAILEDGVTTESNEPKRESEGMESSTNLLTAEKLTTESVDIENTQSTNQLEDANSSNPVVDVKQADSQSEATSTETLTEIVPDAEVSTTSKSVYTSDSSEEKTTKSPGEDTTLAVAAASDTTIEAKDLVPMEESTENVAEGSTVTDSDVTNDTTEPSNKEVRTLASSA